MATALARPRDVILTLVEGGALLDFRTRGGLTPMHVAAKLGGCEAVKVGGYSHQVYTFDSFLVHRWFTGFCTVHMYPAHRPRNCDV